MSIFGDTSAFFAIGHAGDPNHTRAVAALHEIIAGGESILTTSYVIVETIALLQSRRGLGPVRLFDRDIVPLVEIVWVDQDLHDAGRQLLLARDRRKVSLVDYVSFAAMRAAGIRKAFAFDDDFEDEGFQTVPG